MSQVYDPFGLIVRTTFSLTTEDNTILFTYSLEERGPVLTQLLQDLVQTTTDPWLLSLFHSILGQSSQAIQVTLVCILCSLCLVEKCEFHTNIEFVHANIRLVNRLRLPASRSPSPAEIPRF